MTPRPFAILALLLAVPASAQATKFTTAPAGYETKSLNSYANQLGTYASGRQMFVDGTLKGSVLVLQSMKFRLDAERTYRSTTAVGRSWTNVKLSIGTGNYKTFGISFTNNISAAEKVFDAKVAWKGFSAGKPNNPQWGANAAFPFSKPYLSKGTSDLVFDFVFRGGVLDNQAGWAGSKKSFYLDHIRSDGSWLLSSARIPASSTCNDSASSSTTGAYSGSYSIFYGQDFRDKPRQGHLYMSLYGFTGAPNAPVIQALAWGGSVQGVDIGARCNRLHLDLSKALTFITKTTSSTGSIPYTTAYPNQQNIYQPFDARWAGQSVWWQGAWSDSKTKRLSLTTATRLDIRVPDPVLPKLCAEAPDSPEALTASRLRYRSYECFTAGFDLK